MNTETETKAIKIVTGVSLRPDQVAWADEESERQLHRNRSRIIQDAIDHYRRWLAMQRNEERTA